MRLLVSVALIWWLPRAVLAGDDPPLLGVGGSGVWGWIRVEQDERPPVIQLGREAIDFVLRAPGALSWWRVMPLLPEDVFRLRPERDTVSEASAVESCSKTLDAILTDSLNSLGELIAQSKWSVVRPPEPDDERNAGNPTTMQARMSIPLGEEAPFEARLGIETDGLSEDYFVFSTELARPQSALDAKWLAWSTRLDYRSNLEAPASARAEQRVGFRLGRKDTVGVSGRIEDRNLEVATSPLLDLAPAGEFYWNHQWMAGLDSSLKVQQALPDLQSLWIMGESGSSVQLEAAMRASLSSAAKVDLRGTTTPDLMQYGIRLQLEFLLGVPSPRPQERLMLPQTEAAEQRSEVREQQR